MGNETRWERRGWLVLLPAAVLVMVAVGLAGRSMTEAAAVGSGAEVHGSVLSDLGQAAQASGIYLPDITVYVRNVVTGAESPRVITDLKGFFIVPRQAAGDYELCLEAPGYTAACPQQFKIGSDMVFLPTAKIAPESGALTGRVLLEDDSPCNFDDPAFGVSFDTWVEVVTLNGTGVTTPVRANAAGQYLVPAVPAGIYRAVATCESATGDEVFGIHGGWRTVDLGLDNRPPRARFVTASLAGDGVRRVPPGSTVSVTAAVADADPLSYRWVVSGSDGTFVSRDADTVDWTVPDSIGIHRIYVLALDGRGGVDLARLDLSTESGVLFSGTVTGTDGAVVAGARVEVNGAVGTTNAEGAFAVTVEGDSERFVLTIGKQGYQILSEVFDAPVAGGSYELVRAQRFVFDAGRGGTMIESREGQVPGAQVIIPPGSLIDSEGRPATGPVDGYVSSIDLRDPGDRFPGEYAGISATGREVALNSLGAVDVQLFDTAGRPLNLAAGRTAIVRIGIDPLQLGMPEMPASPPPTVPIWFYDPETGVWNQEGSAVRAGVFYEAAVPHFSVINADLEFANPACVRVITDEDRLTLPYQVRISMPAVSPVKVMTETVADALSVVVRLPPFTTMKLEVLDSAGNPIAVATQVHTIGASSVPDFPPYPYDTCTTEVELTIDEPASGSLLQYYGLNTPEEADDYYSRIDPTAVLGTGTVSSSGTTVTGTGTSFVGFIEPGHVLRAGGQVRLVDAVISNTVLTTESPFTTALAGNTFERVGTKPTLAAWKSANGFGAPDQEAAYLNAGDLGLGRFMRMKKTGSNVAFYVSNHGTPPNNGSVDLAAIAMVTGPPEIGLIATVAMEHSPDPGGISPIPYTKFYVYDNTINQKRINKADLDGNGPKYLPNLCIICHGKTPVMDVRGDVDARFIPFDLESFGYSSLFPSVSKAAQQSELKEMNRVIRDDTNISATGIQELIEGWYGGAALPSPNQIASFVPPGWLSAGMSSLYSNVVKPSCRACHITRGAPLDWAAWDLGPAGFKQHPGMYGRICGPIRIMPHAVVTYNNFWRSFPIHQPNELANAGLSSWPSTAPCPNP